MEHLRAQWSRVAGKATFRARFEQIKPGGARSQEDVAADADELRRNQVFNPDREGEIPVRSGARMTIVSIEWAPGGPRPMLKSDDGGGWTMADLSRSVTATRCTNLAFEALTGLCPTAEIVDGGQFLEMITEAGYGYAAMYDLNGLTLRQLVERPEVQQGSFYLFTSGHALALVDGVLTDAEERGPDGRRVKQIYRITKRSTAAVTSLYRGIRAELLVSDILARGLASAVQDALSASARQMGIGVHWSASREVAERFARMSAVAGGYGDKGALSFRQDPRGLMVTLPVVLQGKPRLSDLLDSAEEARGAMYLVMPDSDEDEVPVRYGAPVPVDRAFVGVPTDQHAFQRQVNRYARTQTFDPRVVSWEWATVSISMTMTATGRSTAARKRFSDFERGMRVQVRGSEGIVVKIHGQGNAYTKGYVQIEFDEYPGSPVWYPWREVEIVEGN